MLELGNAILWCRTLNSIQRSFNFEKENQIVSKSQTQDVLDEAKEADVQTNEANAESSNSRSSSTRTQTTSELLEMQSKIKSIEALVTDVNNKITANTQTPTEVWEYPAKSSEQIDARTQALKKEWGLN